MPPKTKRLRQLAEAREAKRSKNNSFQSEDGIASTSASEERDSANPPSSGTDDSPSTEMPGFSGDCPSDTDVDFDPEAVQKFMLRNRLNLFIETPFNQSQSYCGICL